jgi:dTDP-4-dehydrorhamnose reductase
MKILILGANGNLGCQLVKVFNSDDNDVIAWDRGEIDITDRELILKKINDLKPNLVINAAAYNAVDKCERDDAEYELAKKINIDGPKNIAEGCLKTGSTFIHFSTDYVFDGKNKNGYTEQAEPNPINRYGKSKFHGEKRILELSGSGLKWYLIRTSKLFGPQGESEVAKPSFFDIMLSESAKKEILDVINEEASCFTYTPDLAKATKELVASDHGYGIYHIINEKPVTWYAAVIELFKIADKNIKINPVKSDKFPRPALRPKYSVLLNTKLPKLRSYAEALEEYLKIIFN